MPATKKQRVTHTPGPWRPVGDAMKVFAGHMNVCDIRGWGHLTGTGGLHLSEADAVEIQRANTRLIVAAPELLAVLARVQKYFSDFPRQTEHADALLRDVTAAILKGEGGPAEGDNGPTDSHG